MRIKMMARSKKMKKIPMQKHKSPALTPKFPFLPSNLPPKPNPHLNPWSKPSPQPNPNPTLTHTSTPNSNCNNTTNKTLTFTQTTLNTIPKPTMPTTTTYHTMILSSIILTISNRHRLRRLCIRKGRRLRFHNHRNLFMGRGLEGNLSSMILMASMGLLLLMLLTLTYLCTLMI